MHNMNVATAPKTSTFQMRINPEIKTQLENIYAKNGLTLTDAVNVFLQQSLNANGLPFLVSPDNAAFMKAKAIQMLMAELEVGLEAERRGDCYSEEQVYQMLEVNE